jgi:hypothetical protein
MCHGIAGLILLVQRFADAEDDNEVVADLLRKLVTLLVSRFDPAVPTGYLDDEGDGRPGSDPGLLTGALGCMAALLAVTSDVPPSWDRILLIS